MMDPEILLGVEGDLRPVHFMGIAGAGMLALAELLLRRGVQLSGCDLHVQGAAKLIALGARISEGHSADHVAGCRAVVVSSAVPRGHPEVVEAERRGIPVIRRAEALAAAVSGGRLIAVAGTHGKTTTTAMTTLALSAASLNPTGVVGGTVAAWGGNLHAGGNDLFVVEADEYDRSFLALKPEVAVVTNVEADHLDIYRDIDDIRDAFAQFASAARSVVLCADDAGAVSVPLGEGSRRVLYGLERPGTSADLVAHDIVFDAFGSRFSVRDAGRSPMASVVLQVPGLHNVRNALGALAAGWELDVPFDEMAQGLRAFRGVERRFELVGSQSGVTIVDDYAHHPTEIAATLDAARRVYPGRRIVVAFQPHLFSRTRDFAGQFGAALAGADLVFLTEIYAARESPIAGVDSGLIVRSLLRAGGRLAWRGARAALSAALRDALQEGDVVLTLGAGDITHAARELLLLLREHGRLA
jgi:UDP-N-acetylmuramate--alanine ligase